MLKKIIILILVIILVGDLFYLGYKLDILQKIKDKFSKPKVEEPTQVVIIDDGSSPINKFPEEFE